jgi:glutaredoxin
MSQGVNMRTPGLIFAVIFLAACGASPAGADDLAAVSQQQPVLYGTAWCPYCKAARKWFAANNMVYTDCDVEADDRCGRAYAVLKRKYAASGVPTFVYKGKVWGGYDEDQMAEIAAYKK